MLTMHIYEYVELKLKSRLFLETFVLIIDPKFSISFVEINCSKSNCIMLTFLTFVEFLNRI